MLHGHEGAQTGPGRIRQGCPHPLSTDVGGEDLNLQFCHVAINYNIPWNQMCLEQHIGRVNHIGQTHTVRAINFVFEDLVEHCVREAQRLLAHPLPHWAERMTVCYLEAHGGKAERKNDSWDLTWPNGERLTNVVFISKEAMSLMASGDTELYRLANTLKMA